MLKSVAVFIMALFLREAAAPDTRQVRIARARCRNARGRLSRRSCGARGERRRHQEDRLWKARFRNINQDSIAPVLFGRAAAWGAAGRGGGAAAPPASRRSPTRGIQQTAHLLNERAAPVNARRAASKPHLALLVRSACVPGMLSRTFSFQRRQPAPMVALDDVVASSSVEVRAGRLATA